jgi:hydroxyethylthiazole kinase
MTDGPQRCGALLEQLRAAGPLIHHITNDVVTNLTANVTLALGAAPVMAQCREEVEQMVAMAGALVLNIGTLDPAQVDSMLLAGRRARALGLPVVLDPVGAGATDLRSDAAQRLLEAVRPTVVRGNAGELATLAGAGGRVRGVDSRQGLEVARDAVAELARARELIAAVTGPVDFVTDGRQGWLVHNGHPLLARVTGTGCSATSAVACFAAAAPEAPLDAAVAGLAAFGLAGELAAERAAGPGTLVAHLLDALYELDADRLAAGVRVEAAW